MLKANPTPNPCGKPGRQRPVPLVLVEHVEEEKNLNSNMSSLQIDSSSSEYSDDSDEEPSIYADYDFGISDMRHYDFNLCREKWELFHCRSDLEDGQPVDKIVKRCLIFLRDDPLKVCDKESFHMRLLEKVTSNPTGAYYASSAVNYNVFEAILTQDEFSKLNGMTEVERAQQIYEGMAQY